MCSSHNQSCIESKRAYHYIMPSSSPQQTTDSTSNITCVPQRKKMKTDRLVPRRVSIESAVQFSSTVSMRSFYYEDDKLQLGNSSSSSSSSWLQKEEIDDIKSQAKTLAKVHRCLRKSSLSKAEAFAKISPTRYEIQGESLRGLEHITSNGRDRHTLTRSAINAAIREQNTQFLEYIHDNNVMSSSSLTYVDGNGVDQIKRHAMTIDTYRLSKVYGKKTRQSLAYA